METLLTYRLSIFIVCLLGFSCLETLFKLRPLQRNSWKRMFNHLAMISLGTLSVRLLLPFTLFFVSSFSQQKNIGLLHHIHLNQTFVLILSITLLDGFIYLQHVLSHKLSWIWKLHCVHHSDSQLDASSALRFHPLEILLSYIYKAVVVVVFGFSFEAILLFEILLSSLAIFNHSNLYLPPRVEKYLRYVLVTPQMHVIHHSKNISEQNQNFGFCLSIWDRIFKTYLAKEDGQLQIGLQNQEHKNLKEMMML